MKILFLYKYDPKGDSNGSAKRLHYGFMQEFGKLEGVELIVYGPGTNCLPEKTVPYREKRTLSSIVNEVKPDLVLFYSIFNIWGWFPGDLAKCSVPKVAIECDWYAVTNKKWYKENGIGLLIQRGCVDSTDSEVDSVWLPFSCSEEFLPNQKKKLVGRKKKLGFVGTGWNKRFSTIKMYNNRYKILYALSHNNLIDIVGQVFGTEYVRKLGEFKSCLSESGRLHSPPGKVFEIMGSGTLLFTDKFNGSKELFGNNSVFILYEDIRRVLKKARRINNSNGQRFQSIVDNAVGVINSKHLHRHRVIELKNILSDYIQDRRVERIWGR